MTIVRGYLRGWGHQQRSRQLLGGSSLVGRLGGLLHQLCLQNWLHDVAVLRKLPSYTNLCSKVAECKLYLDPDYETPPPPHPPSHMYCFVSPNFATRMQ